MSIDETVLQEWHRSLQAEIEQAQSAIALIEEECKARTAALRAQLRTSTEKLHHIEGLLNVVNAETPPTDAAGAGQIHEGLQPNSARQATRTKSNVADVAYEILLKRGKEMYYKDLADEICATGFQINSQQPATYLLAYIGKDARFEKTKRGYYRAARKRKSSGTGRDGTSRRIPASESAQLLASEADADTRPSSSHPTH